MSFIAKPDSSCTQASRCEDVASALLASAPASAKAIALAFHERAAGGYDQALERHWAEVLRLVRLAEVRPSPSIESPSRSAASRSREPKHLPAAATTPAQRKSKATISAGASGGWLALIACASLAALALPAAPRAAQLDPEDAMVQEFQSFCADYYTQAQCAGAVRFILKTSGSEYFVNLHNDESPEGFLDRLAVAVKGGEALRQKEAALAVKAGE
jgi:hypothetical protein